jgi:hypothetical protein
MLTICVPAVAVIRSAKIKVTATAVFFMPASRLFSVWEGLKGFLSRFLDQTPNFLVKIS